MFSGFQSNAFQNTGYQILPEGSAPVTLGGHYSDYQRYRKSLERMLKAAEARDEQLYRKEVEGLIVQAKEPEIIKSVEAIDKSTKENVVDINFTRVISEIQRLLLYVERVIEKQVLVLHNKEEEELILLLALS